MKKRTEAWAILNDGGHLVYEDVDYSKFYIFPTKALAIKNVRDEERVVKVTITYREEY